MAFKWYCNHGKDAFADFQGVLFDEIGDVQVDAEYAVLVQTALFVAKERRLHVVLASATPSDRLLGLLPDAPILHCAVREHRLDYYLAKVTAGICLLQASAALSQQLYNQGRTTLLFLPGKPEIVRVKKDLWDRGVPAKRIDVLHADLSFAQKAEVKAWHEYTRIVLATSVAEKAVTISDIQDVVCSGTVRRPAWNSHLDSLEDTRGTLATFMQQGGRAGRTGAGRAFRLQHSDEVIPATDREVTPHSVMLALAMENAHCLVRPDECDFLIANPDDVALLRDLTARCFFGVDDVVSAVSTLPLDVLELALFRSARSQGVQREVAALLCLASCKVITGKNGMSIDGALELMDRTHDKAPNESDTEDAEDDKAPNESDTEDAEDDKDERINLGALAGAQARHARILQCEWCTPSKFYGEYANDAVVAAYLKVFPERLVWKKNGETRFFGQPLELTAEAVPDGYYVVLAGRSGARRRGIRRATCSICSIYAQVSDWAMQEAGLTPPTKTATVTSDSTLSGFEKVLVLALRQMGYDLRELQLRPGAWESDLVNNVSSLPTADLHISLPNGNRLCRQERQGEPRWIASTCQRLAEGMRLVADKAVCFVGDAEYCPGLKNIDNYRHMVPLFQDKLRAQGIPVVTEIPGVELEEDGVHWRRTATAAVSALVRTLVEAALPTAEFASCGARPVLCEWVYNGTHGLHYPTCVLCSKLLCDAHLSSRGHRETCVSIPKESFEFPERKRYAQYGYRFVDRGSVTLPHQEAWDLIGTATSSVDPWQPQPATEMATPSSVEPPPPPPPPAPTTTESPPPPPPPPVQPKPPPLSAILDWNAKSIGAQEHYYLLLQRGDSVDFEGHWNSGWTYGFSHRLNKWGWFPPAYVFP